MNHHERRCHNPTRTPARYRMKPAETRERDGQAAQLPAQVAEQIPAAAAGCPPTTLYLTDASGTHELTLSD